MLEAEASQWLEDLQALSASIGHQEDDAEVNMISESEDTMYRPGY
jgi:hypothetical protein